MWGMGIREHDTVLVASPLSLYWGSWGAYIGAERLGARVFPFGAGTPGQTARTVMWMKQMGVTVFYGTPSYALHLAEVADEGVDPADLGLRKLFFSGEPGASVPTIRGRIETAFGAEVYDSGSMAEVSPWMHLGAANHEPGVFAWQDLVYTEVCDPVDHHRVDYGREGTPVYTTLERTSQPMIRLLSNDLTRWKRPRPTAAARTRSCRRASTGASTTCSAPWRERVPERDRRRGDGRRGLRRRAPHRDQPKGHNRNSRNPDTPGATHYP